MIKRNKKYTTNSDRKTQSLAQKIAKEYAAKGAVVGLIGDLGAGKTTFAQGFAQGLGVREKVISPTFILMRQYPLIQLGKTFHHIDLYRIENNINLKESGLSEILKSKDIVLIEWADKILEKLPKETILVYFEKTGENKRQITIK